MIKFTSAEDTMKFLQQFKADLIVTTDNADLQYKKLRDEIIEYVLQELNHNVQPEYVSRKRPLLFLCVIVWFIVVLAVLFFTPDVDRGLVPT
ncbi:unnamed protein product [Trifolium pratense]|uniref:Uncharacterized protein n=1 Tax=Trifolium pratense TaxID=57577 RepID=A0ACB0L133_TRIPR|nr:unnamed protein product [Trifolium pratense]